MSQENVEIAARFYEPATSKADLLNAMPRTIGFFPFQNFDPLHPDPKLLPKVGAFFRPNVATEQMIETQLRSTASHAARERGASRGFLRIVALREDLLTRPGEPG
jgi:hypothetical protein